MSDDLTDTPEAWRHILNEGEQILWQDQPSPKVMSDLQRVTR